MHNPAKLGGITMRYVDALPVAKLREMHPELNGLPLVEPSILDTAGELRSMPCGDRRLQVLRCHYSCTT